MPGKLVIVPCGTSKIWAKWPDAGPTRAAEAYTGPPFLMNRKYAERFGDAWVILSAKYGFIAPAFVMPEPYEVTFKKASTTPIGFEALKQQVKARGLDDFDEVIGLGGVEYRRAIEAAFAGIPCTLTFPFAGLSLGYRLQATKRALEAQD